MFPTPGKAQVVFSFGMNTAEYVLKKQLIGHFKGKLGPMKQGGIIGCSFCGRSLLIHLAKLIYTNPSFFYLISGRPKFGQWQRIWRCDSPGIRFARSAQSRSPRAQGNGLDCSPLSSVVGGAWRMRENVQVVRGSAMKFLCSPHF